MARPKKQTQFEQTVFHGAPRAKFIEFGRIHNSPALRQLCSKVLLDEMSLHAWAKLFNVAGTWVEEWAKDTLDSWRASAPLDAEADGSPRPWYILSPPDPVPPGMRPNRRDGRIACPPPLILESDKLDMEYLLPRASDTEVPVADGSPSWTQPQYLFENDACEQHRSLIGSPWLDVDECSRCGRKVSTKRRKLRQRLNDETAKRDSKIECAAVYVLSARTIEQLAEVWKPAMSKPAMYGWLKEAMALLDLPMRPRGHRAIVH
jgi:hypothetical protein